MIKLRRYLLRTHFCTKLNWFFIVVIVFLLLYLNEETHQNNSGRPEIGISYSNEGIVSEQLSIHPYYYDRLKEFPGERLLHFDLKGAPPKISYILKYISLAKKLGATGLLLEYEDMFPYNDGLEDIAALNAYTIKDIKAIIDTANQHNLTVIPLVQTIGHLEYVLKLEKFKDFREKRNDPQTICVFHKQTYSLLTKMIKQVLKAHKNSRYFHVGGDEAEFIGICPKCQNIIKKRKWTKADIYFYHIRRIAEFITRHRPEVKPIIWGDRFKKHNEKFIEAHQMPKLVEVMLWNYEPWRTYFPFNTDMQMLTKLFKHIWIAGAFKGATGSMKIVTDIDYHVMNTKSWMEFVEKWKSKINFKGIVLTGWQRYNHFMPLCELLPVGLPSLAVNLQILTRAKGFNYDQIMKQLECRQPLPRNLGDIRRTFLPANNCKFPGFQIYRDIHFFNSIKLNSQLRLQKIRAEELSFYNIIHNSSFPTYVHRLHPQIYKKAISKLNSLEKKFRINMKESYDNHTIEEWIQTYFLPLRFQLEAAIKIIQTQSAVTVWPQRPFKNYGVKAKFDDFCSTKDIMGCTLLFTY